MIKKLIITLILIAAAASHAYPDDFLHPQKYVLDNGMTVLLQEEHFHPTTTIQIYAKGGSINENREISGLTHLAEHLFFRNKNTKNGLSFKAQLENWGANLNGETTPDYTLFYATLPSKNTYDALDLMADAYINYNISGQDVESEKKIVLNEYNIYKDNLMATMSDQLSKVAFPNHPYGQSAIGTEENIKSFTKQDILNYKAKFFTPSNTVLIIVGDIDIDETLQMCEALFKNFKGPVPCARPVINNIMPYSNQEIIEEKDIDDYFLLLSYKTPGINKMKEIYALDLITFILGQGEDCVLRNTLIKQKKLAEDIFANFTTSKDPGIFSIMAICKPDKGNSVKKELLAAINKLKSGGLTDEEFSRGKNFLIANYTFGLETNEDKAKALGFYEVLDSSKIACTYIDNIKKITKQDVVRQANITFNTSHYFLVYKPKHLPEEKNEKTKPPFPFNMFNW